MRQGANAELTTRFIPISSDGITSPTVITAACPEITLTGVTEVFTLGIAKLGSTTLAGVNSIDVDFGVKYVVNYADGMVYPESVIIENVKPTFTYGLTDLAGVSTVTNEGLAGTATVFARARAVHDTVIAAATLAHIKIIANDSYAIPRVWQGANEGDATFQVFVQCEYDGTNAPLIYTKDQAIA
jgi:hypothetical protein